jgi:hypothetical protein
MLKAQERLRPSAQTFNDRPMSTEKASQLGFAPQIAQSAASLPIRRNREKAMSATNSVVAVYDSHEEAERRFKALQQAGVDMKSLSIAGRGTHTDEHVVGYYNAGDRMKYWGKVGAFWGGFWGLLFGSAAFAIPGIGPFSLPVRWLAGLSQVLRERLLSAGSALSEQAS